MTEEAGHRVRLTPDYRRLERQPWFFDSLCSFLYSTDFANLLRQDDQSVATSSSGSFLLWSARQHWGRYGRRQCHKQEALIQPPIFETGPCFSCLRSTRWMRFPFGKLETRRPRRRLQRTLLGGGYSPRAEESTSDTPTSKADGSFVP